MLHENHTYKILAKRIRCYNEWKNTAFFLFAMWMVYLPGPADRLSIFIRPTYHSLSDIKIAFDYIRYLVRMWKNVILYMEYQVTWMKRIKKLCWNKKTNAYWEERKKTQMGREKKIRWQKRLFALLAFFWVEIWPLRQQFRQFPFKSEHSDPLRPQNKICLLFKSKNCLHSKNGLRSTPRNKSDGDKNANTISVNWINKQIAQFLI